MVKSISIKDAELFELVNGISKSGGDVKALLRPVIEQLRTQVKDGIGNDYDVVIATGKADVETRMAELKERLAVLSKMEKA
jgi:hypothetical protein